MLIERALDQPNATMRLSAGSTGAIEAGKPVP